MNTPILNINRRDLGRSFRLIGSGSDGDVYNYNDKYAIKIFKNFDSSKAHSKMKLAKIEDMSKIRTQGVALPIGLTIVDGQICGCFSKLVDYIEGRKNFNSLDAIDNTRRLIAYILKAEEIMTDLHERGFIIGDIRRDNIMIDRNGNPIYIDLDNSVYGKYTFDNIPDRAATLYRTYGGPILSKDSDILVFSIMALRILTKDPDFSFDSSREILKKALDRLRFSKSERKVIDEIFSSQTNKPHISSILR